MAGSNKEIKNFDLIEKIVKIVEDNTTVEGTGSLVFKKVKAHTLNPAVRSQEW